MNTLYNVVFWSFIGIAVVYTLRMILESVRASMTVVHAPPTPPGREELIRMLVEADDIKIAKTLYEKFRARAEELGVVVRWIQASMEEAPRLILFLRFTSSQTGEKLEEYLRSLGLRFADPLVLDDFNEAEPGFVPNHPYVTFIRMEEDDLRYIAFFFSDHPDRDVLSRVLGNSNNKDWLARFWWFATTPDVPLRV